MENTCNTDLVLNKSIYRRPNGGDISIAVHHVPALDALLQKERLGTEYEECPRRETLWEFMHSITE